MQWFYYYFFNTCHQQSVSSTRCFWLLWWLQSWWHRGPEGKQSGWQIQGPSHRIQKDFQRTQKGTTILSSSFVFTTHWSDNLCPIYFRRRKYFALWFPKIDSTDLQLVMAGGWGRTQPVARTLREGSPLLLCCPVGRLILIHKNTYFAIVV